MINVKTATIAELVAFYNKHADKQVKKFQDRATAERRVSELLATLTNFAPPSPSRVAAAQEDSQPALHPIATAIVSESGGKKGRAANNNEAVRKSWELDHVRAARSARHAVAVEETTEDRCVSHGLYKSTFKAFVALGLPLAKHTTFRAKLKKEGKAEINGFHFRLVEE